MKHAIDARSDPPSAGRRTALRHGATLAAGAAAFGFPTLPCCAMKNRSG
jgi:hypothetical protein